MTSGRIMTLLAVLAEQSGETVSKARLDLMVEMLIDMDPVRVCVALRALVESSRRFPTIAEIKAKMGVAELSNDDKGREVAERIWNVVTRGWASTLTPEIAKRRDDFVGPIGIAVVQMAGGWMQLAENVMNDEETTRKAQWREYARVVASQGGFAAPQLRPGPNWDIPKLPGVVDVSKLISS